LAVCQEMSGFMPKLGFLITAYDQKREVKFTVDMLRNKWLQARNSPISIVISGDPDRTLKFPNDPLTRVTTIDDMVGKDFNGLVSTSIMKQMRHGMVELQDLERVSGEKIEYIVHMHGDILLLNETGFFEELEKFAAAGKYIAIDTVGQQKNDYIHFDGFEPMPQLFVVKKFFVDASDFLFDMCVVGDLEKRSTEWALKGNFARAYRRMIDRNFYDMDDNEAIKYGAHVVAAARGQWQLHNHWGGFCHFGNQLHYPALVREALNEQVLKAHGISLSSW
jgi:hypothetical protein